jgi:exodeoxyribonuclease V alpha subunit
LLEVDAQTHRFQRHAGAPIEAQAVVVDEFSMVDAALAAALLDALPTDARLVIVGDADQLPSVGPGAVLRELIASAKVPTVRLDEVFRQAEKSGIVQNAHRIFRGELPVGASDPDADFFVIARRDADQAAAVIEELVTSRIPRRFGLDPLDDIQVLTPMHRGAAGTHALNARLQAATNPGGRALDVRGVPYRVGDKVMQTKNDYERASIACSTYRSMGAPFATRTAIWTRWCWPMRPPSTRVRAASTRQSSSRCSPGTS